MAKTYTKTEVAAALNMLPRRVQFLTDQELVKPGNANPGTGFSRGYTRKDMFQIIVVEEVLKGSCMTMKQLSHALARLEERGRLYALDPDGRFFAKYSDPLIYLCFRKGIKPKLLINGAPKSMEKMRPKYSSCQWFSLMDLLEKMPRD